MNKNTRGLIGLFFCIKIFSCKAQLNFLYSYLMSICFTKQRAGKDENVEENTEGVKHTEDYYQADEKCVQTNFFLQKYVECEKISYRKDFLLYPMKQRIRMHTQNANCTHRRYKNALK
jgi:hypothetical protein